MAYRKKHGTRKQSQKLSKKPTGESGDNPGRDVPDEDDHDFLRKYRPEEYPKPSVTVDLVILTVVDTLLNVLLIRRKGHPYKGKWALPGGFVDVGNAIDKQGESVERAAHRELAQKTGLPEGACFLEQLYTFGEPNRDPRMRVISVAYFALVSPEKAPIIKAGDDASETRWFPMEEAVDLAFDHPDILEMAVERIRGKLNYTPIAFELVPPTFTIPELRAVHEAIQGTDYDPSNFRRRFRRMMTDGIIDEAPGKRHTTRRPAKVYRFARR